VPKIDDAKFQSIAAATKEGCPVSGALKGNVQMDLDAKLV
jgi:osmotically inducible protein OsmC